MGRISSRMFVRATFVFAVVGIAPRAPAQAMPPGGLGDVPRVPIAPRAPAQAMPAEPFAPPRRADEPRMDAPAPARDPSDILILGVDAETARDRLESRLIRVLDQVDQMYDLTPEQVTKLELAGRGEIKRFFDRFSEMKKQVDHSEGGRIEVRLAARDIESIRREFQRGYFDDDSLFSKMLKKMLTPAQRARYEDRDRVASYRTRVNWVLMPLRRELGLTREQHLRFLQVIAGETRPLQRYGELDEDAILLQASRLPEARLRPIFNDAQWRRLGKRFDRVKWMEGLLVEEGYLADGRD
jgi:hypothetical protein